VLLLLLPVMTAAGGCQGPRRPASCAQDSLPLLPLLQLQLLQLLCKDVAGLLVEGRVSGTVHSGGSVVVSRLLFILPVISSHQLKAPEPGAALPGTHQAKHAAQHVDRQAPGKVQHLALAHALHPAVRGPHPVDKQRVHQSGNEQGGNRVSRSAVRSARQPLIMVQAAMAKVQLKNQGRVDLSLLSSASPS